MTYEQLNKARALEDDIKACKDTLMKYKILDKEKKITIEGEYDCIHLSGEKKDKVTKKLIEIGMERLSQLEAEFAEL